MIQIHITFWNKFYWVIFQFYYFNIYSLSRERHIKKEKLRIAKIIYNERLLKCHGLSHKINKKEVESDDKSPNVEKILPNEQKKELTKPIVRIFSTKIHHLKWL